MLLVLVVKVSFGLGILFCVCLWLSCIVVVFCMSFWYLTVGSLGSKRKLLAARNVCTFLDYAPNFIITFVLPLSAWTSIVFSFTSYLFNSFLIYNRLFRRMLLHFLKYFYLKKSSNMIWNCTYKTMFYAFSDNVYV